MAVEQNRVDWKMMVPAAALLAGALLRLPYDYYTLLRIGITAAAIWAIFLSYQRTQKYGGTAVVGLTIALLFNPIIPIHLSRALWFPVDLAAAAWFGFQAFKR